MYFSKFPIVSYPTNIKNNKAYIVARNIIRRVALSEETKSSNGAFIEYHIKDGERPEHIADRVYGSPEDHWIVLLANDIIDPYHDWYKSSSVFEEYVLKKYDGYALFGTIAESSKGFRDIKVGATIYSDPLSVASYDSFRVSATVTGVNENFRYVVINTNSGNRFQRVLATDQRPSNLGGPGGFQPFQIVNTNGVQLSLWSYRVLPYLQAVHHFEINTSTIDSKQYPKSTIVVDPLVKRSSSLSYADPAFNAVPPKVGIHQDGESDGSITFLGDTFLGKYINFSYPYAASFDDEYAVSNYKYEYDLNESRRKIKVLHPRYLDTVKREFDALLRV